MFAAACRRAGRNAGRAAVAVAGGTALGLLAREERVAQCISVWGSASKAAPLSSSASAPASPLGGKPSAPASDQMSRYKLHEVLGRGKFGVVHRGTLVSTGESVAIKLLPKDGKGTHLHEAEMMRSIFWHPHIVNLREAFDTADHHVLVMDLAQGGELFDRIVAMGSYSEADASEVMRYVMSAVAHCHARGVAHRDMKPENIMLASQDTAVDVRICDFGLAQRVDAASGTLTGKVGTVGYAAPEMLSGDPPTYSSRVDEWAVGVILYILLGGYHPFDPDVAADDATITRRVKKDSWSFNDPSWNSVSDSAKGLVKALLAHDPKERISADDALKHPWLRGDSASNKPLLKSAVRLAAFNEARQAWRDATKAAINREGLDDNDRASALAAAFKMIDTNGDGQICQKELTVFLNKLEARASPAEIEAMVKHADVDGDGLISIDEFVAMNL